MCVFGTLSITRSIQVGIKDKYRLMVILEVLALLHQDAIPRLPNVPVRNAKL